jgi:hypothetical protein
MHMTNVAQQWVDDARVGSGGGPDPMNPATGEVPADRTLRHRALGELADFFDAYADELGRQNA